MQSMDTNWNDSLPIYRQLRDRVVAMILEGALNDGDPLPSVRSVAAEYRLNPLTVLKGYQQLVDEKLSLYDPMAEASGRGGRTGPAEVEKKLGVRPDQVLATAQAFEKLIEAGERGVELLGVGAPGGARGIHQHVDGPEFGIGALDHGVGHIALAINRDLAGWSLRRLGLRCRLFGTFPIVVETAPGLAPKIPGFDHLDQ